MNPWSIKGQILVGGMYQVRELAEKEGEGGVFQLLRQDVTRFLTTILIGTTYWASSSCTVLCSSVLSGI